jgi:hypothetical protein
LFFSVTNLFFGAEPIIDRRTWSVAPHPEEFLRAPADSFFAGTRINRLSHCVDVDGSWHRITSGDHGSTG